MSSKIKYICPTNISENEDLINCTEVMIQKQLSNLKDYHFPKKNKKNRFIVSLISIFHSISIIYIFAGLFLNPKYLIFYSSYITFLLFSLLVHGNNCFLTILKGNISNYDKNPIHLQEKTSVFILCSLIIISLLGYVKPILSLQNISRLFLDIIYNNSEIISFAALFIFLLFFIIYIFNKLFNKSKRER